MQSLIAQTPGRLVTLIGPGGVGKTQLALAVAHRLAEHFANGVWFVDVASVCSGELLTSAIAGVLLLRQKPGRTLLDTILNFLRTSDLLIVLDNCEHVIEACANVAEQALATASNVRILATSRERLRISRETVWQVPTLPNPAPGARLTPGEVLNYPATRLFVERATALQPRFVLNDETVQSVVSICDTVDGLPLALELAAGRTTAMSLSDIRERLITSLQLLSRGSRTAPGRQQTMRATMDWSYSLLSGPEQAVLRRLAVFSGGWTLKASESVCADESSTGEDVVELLTSLVEKSLVVLTEKRDGRSHYRLLEPVRQYATERLVESGELEEVRERHARYMVEFAKPLGVVAGVGGPDRWTSVDTLLREYANLQVALNWAVETRNASIGLQLAAALEHTWKTRVGMEEARAWTTAVLGLPGADSLTRERGLVLCTAAMVAFTLNDYTEAENLYRQAIPLAQRLGDPWVTFVCLIDYGMFAQHRGDRTTAREYWEEALTVARSSRDRAGEAILHNRLAGLELLAGNLQAARLLYTEGLRLERQAGDPLGTAQALDGLATIALKEGDARRARTLTARLMRLNPPAAYGKNGVLKRVQIALAEGAIEDARNHLKEALTVAKAYGDQLYTVETLDAVAEVIEAYRDNPRLSLLLGMVVEAAWPTLGAACSTIEAPFQTRWWSRLAEDVPEDELTASRAEGRKLSVDDALALAEIEVTRMAVAPVLAEDGAGQLTPRQREVVVLVGQGLTNRQIARRLVVTERAAAAHIEHILDKLGVNSRTEIAVWASEHGLLASHSPGDRERLQTPGQILAKA